MQSKDEVDKKELKKSICKEQEKFSEGLKNSYQIYKVNQDWQQKMKEKKIQSYKQLKGVSSAINMLTKEMRAQDEEAKLQNLTIEVGIAKTKKNNKSSVWNVIIPNGVFSFFEGFVCFRNKRYESTEIILQGGGSENSVKSHNI